MRRSDREIKELPEILDIFDKAPFITVSFTRQDNSPYGLPLSLARSDDSTFYFHCAHEGEKIECIMANQEVSLSAVTKCTPFSPEGNPSMFTLEYTSAMARGHAQLVTDRDEKIMALKLIAERFLPDNMMHFREAIDKSLDRTAVVRISLIERPTGKQKLRKRRSS